MTSTPKVVDLHVHAGLDLLVRRHSVVEAARAAQQMNAWIVVKSHLGSTCEAAWEARRQGLPVSGSIVLNQIVGGVDSTAVARAVFAHGTDSNARPIVFLPTMRGPGHGEDSPLAHPGFTRASWSSASAFDADGVVSEATREVLRCVRDLDLVVATGHCTRGESLRIVEAADELGVERVLLTHATHPMSGFTVGDVGELASNPSVWVEVTALAVLLGRHDRDRIGELVNVHPRVVLSSDLGQPSQPDLLCGWQIAAQWCPPEVFDQVSVVNPPRLLFR